MIVTDLVTDWVCVCGGGEVKGSHAFPCKILNNHPIVPNAEIICVEFHQLKCKWLLLDVTSRLPKMTWNLLRLSQKLLIFIYKNLKICLL